MNQYVGTSGYSYKEWKGSFYPEDLPEKQMLRFYGERFRTVEINNTFYRTELKEWARRLQQSGWNEASIFFKHEEAGKGPQMAKRFLELL